MTIESNFKTILYTEENSIGVVTINREKALNALNETVIEELISLLDALETAPLKGLIFTGSGEKAFIAGADIKAMTGMSSSEGETFSRRGQELTHKLEGANFPIIAAVNGFALGGGLEMAMACDFIYSTESSVFGLPEASLGLVPGFGGTQRLSKLVGRNRAKELVYSGRKIKSDEALRIGLVLDVLPNKEALFEKCFETFKFISRNSPFAVARAKEIMNQGADESLADGLNIEAKQFGAIFDSHDMKEGVNAFNEKRRPEFLGK